MREDWIEYKLGEIHSIVYGKGLPTKNLTSNGYPVFGANGIIGYYTEYKYENQQILISCRGAASGAINVSPKKCFITNNSLIVETDSIPYIEKSFLYYILQGANRTQIITGSAQPQVTINNANTLVLKLAPLPIQRAIVLKIENLFASLDKGIADLKTAQEQLKVYRQAVLKKAFEGKLTKSELGLNGLQDDRINNEEILQSTNPKNHNSDNEGDNLPKGWKWVKLGEVADMCLGKMLDKAKNKGEERPYLGNINVRWGSFDLKNLKKMRIENNEQERYQVIKNDLVICEGGEPGRCSVWTSNMSVFIQKALHRVRPKSGYNSFYIYYYFNLLSNVQGLSKYFTGTTIKHLTGQKLKEIIISFPPTLAEQHAIVREIESRLSVCDKVEQSIAEALEKAEALRQSILKKAFEGKLLSKAEIAQCKQEADYEPAAKLLERIKKDNRKKY